MAVATSKPLTREGAGPPHGAGTDLVGGADEIEWASIRASCALREAAESALRDTRAAVRSAAAVTYRASPDAALADRARQTLRELLTGGTVERRAGLRAAIQLANPFSIPRFFGFLEHPDAETRRLALAAIGVPHLGLLAPELVRGRIEPLLQDPAPAVRAAAHRALTRVASTSLG